MYKERFEEFLDDIYSNFECDEKNLRINYGLVDKFLSNLADQSINDQKEIIQDEKKIIDSIYERKECAKEEAEQSGVMLCTMISIEEKIRDLKNELMERKSNEKLKQLLCESLGEIKRMQIFYEHLKNILENQSPSCVSFINERTLALWNELSLFISSEFNCECKSIDVHDEKYKLYVEECQRKLVELNPRDSYTIHEMIGIKFPSNKNSDTKVTFSIAHNSREIRKLFDSILQYSHEKMKIFNSSGSTTTLLSDSKKHIEFLQNPVYNRVLGSPKLPLSPILMSISTNYLSFLKHKLCTENEIICSPKIYICLEELIFEKDQLHPDYKIFSSLHLLLNEIYDITVNLNNNNINLNGLCISEYLNIHRNNDVYKKMKKNSLLSEEMKSFLLCYEDIIKVESNDNKIYHLIPAIVGHLLVHPKMTELLPKADKNDGLSLLKFYSSFLYHPQKENFHFYYLKNESEIPSKLPYLSIIDDDILNELYITYIIRPNVNTQLYKILNPYNIYSLINDIENVKINKNFEVAETLSVTTSNSSKSSVNTANTNPNTPVNTNNSHKSSYIPNYDHFYYCINKPQIVEILNDNFDLLLFRFVSENDGSVHVQLEKLRIFILFIYIAVLCEWRGCLCNEIPDNSFCIYHLPIINYLKENEINFRKQLTSKLNIDLNVNEILKSSPLIRELISGKIFNNLKIFYNQIKKEIENENEKVYFIFYISNKIEN